MGDDSSSILRRRPASIFRAAGAIGEFRDLRAGWRLLVFAALSVLAFLALGVVVGSTGLLTGRGVRSPVLFLVSECLILAAVTIGTAVMAPLEGRQMGAYGLPFRNAFGCNFWIGAITGVSALAMLLVLIRLSGDLEFGASSPVNGLLWRAAGAWGGVFLAVAFCEEFTFRGYSLFTLASGVRFWPAAVLLSLSFGGVHLSNRGEDWMGAVTAGLIGLLFCFSVRCSGTLWFAVGFHFGWDYAQSFLFGVPDSGFTIPDTLWHARLEGSRWITGASVGPEGSVLCLLVVTALFPLVAWLYPRKRIAVTEVISHAETN